MDYEKEKMRFVLLAMFMLVMGWLATDWLEIDFLVSKEKASDDLEDAKFWYDLGVEEATNKGFAQQIVIF